METKRPRPEGTGVVSARFAPDPGAPDQRAISYSFLSMMYCTTVSFGSFGVERSGATTRRIE